MNLREAMRKLHERDHFAEEFDKALFSTHSQFPHPVGVICVALLIGLPMVIR